MTLHITNFKEFILINSKFCKIIFFSSISYDSNPQSFNKNMYIKVWFA